MENAAILGKIVVANMGWVEICLSHSTVCPVLLRQMEMWKKWWNIQIKVNST